MTLPTNTPVRLTADAAARMPEMARHGAGRVLLDEGRGAVCVKWNHNCGAAWLRVEDLEVVP